MTTRPVSAARSTPTRSRVGARLLLCEPMRALVLGASAHPLDAVELALSSLAISLSTRRRRALERTFGAGHAGALHLPTGRGGADVRLSHGPDGCLVVEATIVETTRDQDSLTGLVDRVTLCTWLDRKLAEVSDTNEANAAHVSVIFVNLDRFKLVNEALGHEAGDILLRHVGARLRRTVRHEDVVARVGGGEFAVGVCSLTDRDVDELAARIGERLAQPVAIDGQELHVTASIGISASPAGCRDGQSLLRDADSAMSSAKARHVTAVRFDETIRTRLLQSVAIERDLRRALECDEIELRYQPTVSLATGCIVSVEGLARWNSPLHGLVNPGVFIPVAEESGLILALGEHVLRLAAKQAAAWRRSPELGGATVWVNVSPHQLRAGGFAELAAQILREHDLPASALGLEITESALTEDLEYEVAALAATGVPLALDDFGTGYSSMSALRRHPFALLKIDRSFVEGLSESSDDHAIVRAVVQLGHALGTSVTAEGVEDVQQLHELKALGCDSASGFFIARPAPGCEVNDLLLSGRPLLSATTLGGGPVRAKGMVGKVGALRVADDYESSGPSADRSAAEVIINLLHTSGTVAQRIAAFLRPFDLSTEEFNVLMVLEGASTATPPAVVADRVMASTTQPHAVLDRLIRRRLADTTGEGDVTLTETGRTLLAGIKPRLHEVESGLVATFDRGQRAQWLGLTGALMQSITSYDDPGSHTAQDGV